MVELPEYRPPQNSWEISYVISTYKYWWDIGIERAEIIKNLSYKRRKELRLWMEWNINSKWCRDHHRL